MDIEQFLNSPPEGFSPWVVAVGCFICVRGEILYLKRSMDRPHPNTWCIPGGKVEAGESLIDAVCREIREETSIELDPATLQMTHPLFVRKGAKDALFHMFEIQMEEKPSVVLNKEHAEYTWAQPKEALRLPLIPGGKEALLIGSSLGSLVATPSLPL